MSLCKLHRVVLLSLIGQLEVSLICGLWRRLTAVFETSTMNFFKMGLRQSNSMAFVKAGCLVYERRAKPRWEVVRKLWLKSRRREPGISSFEKICSIRFIHCRGSTDEAQTNTEDGARGDFPFLLGLAVFLPYRCSSGCWGFGPLWGAFSGSRGIDRLNSRYSGDRAPIPWSGKFSWTFRICTPHKPI
jgi:hypothetical protein